MKQVFVLLLGVSLLTACLKEEPLTPNANASSPAQGIPVNGGGSNGVQFFNYTINGDSVRLNAPFFSGTSSFGQILSRTTLSEFFQIGVSLSGRTLPDTIELSPFSTTFVYNETITKTYNGEAGYYIFVSDTQGKLTGTFDSLIMKNNTDPNDSIFVTKGSFSVNK